MTLITLRQRGRSRSTHRFVVEVRVTVQCGLDMLRPLPLTLRVLLGAQSVDVVREQGGGII